MYCGPVSMTKVINIVKVGWAIQSIGSHGQMLHELNNEITQSHYSKITFLDILNVAIDRVEKKQNDNMRDELRSFFCFIYLFKFMLCN